MPGPDARYTNLYMKNLDPDITEALLQEKFSPFGKIVSLAIAKDNNGMSKGFGFVNYENPDDAKKAMEAMNGTQFGSFIYPFLCSFLHEKKMKFLDVDPVYYLVLICHKQVQRFYM